MGEEVVGTYMILSTNRGFSWEAWINSSGFYFWKMRKNIHDLFRKDRVWSSTTVHGSILSNSQQINMTSGHGSKLSDHVGYVWFFFRRSVSSHYMLLMWIFFVSVYDMLYIVSIFVVMIYILTQDNLQTWILVVGY